MDGVKGFERNLNERLLEAREVAAEDSVPVFERENSGVADGGDGGPGKGPLRPYILNSLMSEKILNFLVQFITHVIDLGGYGGVAALMGIESACIPLPSEIIMPFAGYLVYLGHLNLFWTATAGAVGCNAGSLIAYWIGAKGGRPLVERYGKWVLMSHHDLDRMTRFFDKHGSITVLLARLLPVVRTFIAFSCGNCQDAAASISHLYICGLVAVVPCLGIRRQETGGKLGRSAFALS